MAGLLRGSEFEDEVGGAGGAAGSAERITKPLRGSLMGSAIGQHFFDCGAKFGCGDFAVGRSGGEGDAGAGAFDLGGDNRLFQLLGDGDQRNAVPKPFVDAVHSAMRHKEVRPLENL